LKRNVALLFLALALLFAFSPVESAEANSVFLHFIEENRSRYESFRVLNPDIPFDKVVALANANVDKGFYNEIVTVSDPDCISVLVNKNFALPNGYVPDDLVSIGGNHRMRKEAAEQFEKMWDEMYRLGYRVFVMSTYRTNQSQAGRYDNAVRTFGRASADRQFARPGHSEHQTGLAVDVLQRTNVRYMTQARFESTKEFEWMTENAHRYGFILRYPSEYRDVHGFIFEPWHWRYVGVCIATEMFDEGIALYEEYYGRYLVISPSS